MDNLKRVPHCSHWGAYTLLVRDGRIVGVEPFGDDPSPSPIIGSVPRWADSAHRIAQPMVRESWLARCGPGPRRPDERFVPVGWDDATELVAGEIDRVRHAFGNSAIFAGSYGWTSCGRFHHAPSHLKRMLSLVGGYTGHVDTYSIAAGPAILRHVLGNADACGGGSNTLDNIAEHAETVLVFGALTPRTAQSEAGGLARHTLETHLRRMVERKVRIVLLSPVRDDLPDWVPAEWWPVRPNTDVALLLGMATEIVKAGCHAQDFLARCCSGSERFLRYLAGEADGREKDAEWAAGITGIGADRIRTLALDATRCRTMITMSWSLQRADHGEQPFWAALGLASVIGQIGLPGGGVGYGYGSLGGVGAPIVLGRSPALPSLPKPNEDFIPVARIADMLLQPGASFTYEGETHRYPDTRLVYWAGGNPFHHHQDLNRLRQAWSRPETIVVQDPMWTATARRADIVLPATTSLERNDISGNKRSDHLVAMHKAIEPVGQARDDYDIFRGIARRLGVEASFTEGRDEMQWIRTLYEVTREDVARRFDFAMPDFDAFWRHGSAPVPTKADHVHLAEFRDDPVRHRLRTESGRIVLGSDKLQALALPDCPPHPAWLEPAEWLGAAGGGEFHLISSQPPGKLHSQLDDASLSQESKRRGIERVRMNPADAQRKGLPDGGLARLWNPRGQCLAVVAHSAHVSPGVLVLATGSWYSPEDDGANPLERAGNPNVLTLDKGSSGYGQGCAAHTCTVDIEAHVV